MFKPLTKKKSIVKSFKKILDNGISFKVSQLNRNRGFAVNEKADENVQCCAKSSAFISGCHD